MNSKNTNIDSWKHEVKRVFQKKNPAPINQKIQSIVTMHQNMSPSFKKSVTQTSQINSNRNAKTSRITQESKA